MATSPKKKSPARKKPAAARAAARVAPARGAALPSPFDPQAARDALTRQTQAIARLQKDTSRNAWQIGRRLAQIVQLELHVAGGFDTIEAYAESALGISRTTAFQWMRVSQAFSEDVVASFGFEKLDRGLAYIAKTPEDEKPSQLPTLAVRVPDADGKVKRKKFSETTIVELKRAVQRESSRAAAKSTRVAPSPLSAHAARLTRANRALDEAVGQADADRASVSLREDGGDVLVDVRGVPLVHAAEALAALAKALGAG